MNTKNNKRKRSSMAKITNVFIQLLQTKKLQEISVTDICKRANLNRATFYSNYQDIYDLADKVLLSLHEEVNELYRDEITNGFNNDSFTKLLKHIKDNQTLYKTCFKLGIDNFPIEQYHLPLSSEPVHQQYIDYHIEFFRGGFNRIVKIWLDNNCKETPEEIAYVIKSEYERDSFFE